MTRCNRVDTTRATVSWFRAAGKHFTQEDRRLATTCYFEETIRDKEDKGTPLDLEFGRSSSLGGVNLMYLVVDGKSFILDEATGKRIYSAMMGLGEFLRYD